jgi:hypothetical protein
MEWSVQAKAICQRRRKKMKNPIDWLLNPPTEGPAAIVLLRLMAGGVFFLEGVLKFVYANQGVGRFTKFFCGT